MESVNCFSNLGRASQVLTWDASAHHFGNGVTLHNVYTFPPTATHIRYDNISLATHLSFNRVPKLRSLCATWQGFIVATVLYASVNNATTPKTFSAESIASRVLASDHACHLTVAVFTETYKTRDDAVALYPANILRNYAVALAQRNSPGKVVLPIDVDLVPMGDFSWVNTLIPGRAYVIPVFETTQQLDTPNTDAIKCTDKICIANMLEQETLKCFNCEDFHRGHNATPLRAWLNSNEHVHINMELHEGYYDPFIAWIKNDPAILPYHPWFRCREKDRIFHTVQLHRNGVEFFVAPNSWMLHVYNPRRRRSIVSKMNEETMFALYAELRLSLIHI